MFLATGAQADWCAGQRPSVVLVTLDTVRADHLPMWGASDVKTPALQFLAERGAVFTQAITSTPLTLPSHATLLTGTYPHFHGLRDNSAGRLSSDIPTLASILRKEGYATAAFMGASVLDRGFGLDQGFEYYGDRFRSPRLLGLTAERRAEAVIDEALNWLRGNQRTPFFIWLHLYDPHAPYEAPGAFAARGYKGEIEYMDTQLGRFFQRLQGQGQFDQSLVLAVADHGEDLNQHGEPAHGFFVYDSVIHVPLILKFPHNRFAGKQVPQQVRLLDVLPTILQILQLPGPETVQGTGLVALVMGKRGEDLNCYVETLYPRLHFGWSSLLALRTGRYKFIEAPLPELYDLENDAGETSNLYENRRALANQLKNQLDQLRARYQGKPTESGALDAELRERLKSLGYVTLAPGVRISEDSKGLADPKTKIGVYAQVYRGMQAFVEKKLQQAIAHFTSALEKDSSLSLAHDYLGSTYLALNQNEDAIRSYRRALELAPGRSEIATNLAYAYLQAGKPAEAEQGFRLVTRLAPRDWQSWQLLGVSLTQQQKYEEALSAFQKALQENPAQPETLYNLGLLHQQQGKFLLAVEVFRKLIKMVPDDPQIWNDLASSYQGAGLMDPAWQAFEKALSLNPAYAAAYYNFGNLLAQQARWEEAAEKYGKAVEIDPDFALGYHNLSVVLEAMGRKEEAVGARQTYERLSRRKTVAP